MSIFPASTVGDLQSGHGSHPPVAIVDGSTDVIINGKGAARVGDTFAPHANAGGTAVHAGTVAVGSGTVMVNGNPAARIGSPTNCGGAVVNGSANVLVGD